LAAACLLAVAGTAQAQNFGPNDVREIWTTTTGTQVWKNGYGECWHSAFGPPPPYGECNPAPVAQYVVPPPAPAPVVTPPPPPPAPVIQPAPMPPRPTRG
jgi:hypothetical protein